MTNCAVNIFSHRKRQNRSTIRITKRRHFVSDRHRHFVNKLPIDSLASSRADPDRDPMQIMPSRNLTDRLYVTAETSIFTVATAVPVRTGEALRIYHCGMKVLRTADRFARFKQTRCVHVQVEITVSDRTRYARVFRVSRVGYFGHPPDYGNDESTAPCIA